MQDYQQDWAPCRSSSDVPINKDTQTYNFYSDASTQADDTYLKSTNASSKTMSARGLQTCFYIWRCRKH